MTVELKVRFPVDDAELSAAAPPRVQPRRPGDPDIRQPPAGRPRLERHSLTWVGAFSAGRLVGFVHVVWDGGTHAFILDTMVDPGFQRHGIGRDLVRTVTDEAFRAGCDWVHVDYEPEYVSFYEHPGSRPPPDPRSRSRPRPASPPSGSNSA